MAAEDRVRELLRIARELVRDECPEGGEEVFLAVFRQLCIERELDGPQTDTPSHRVTWH